MSSGIPKHHVVEGHECKQNATTTLRIHGPNVVNLPRAWITHGSQWFPRKGGKRTSCRMNAPMVCSTRCWNGAKLSLCQARYIPMQVIDSLLLNLKHDRIGSKTTQGSDVRYGPKSAPSERFFPKDNYWCPHRPQLPPVIPVCCSQALAEALRANATVTQITLFSNYNISPDGAKACRAAGHCRSAGECVRWLPHQMMV